MSGYSWVSVVSIFCYLFLLLTFASSGIKTKKVLHTFIAMLAIMILWNGGSLGMRLQLWPSPYFWHHVSLLGMLMVTVGYFHFVLDFLDDKNSHGRIGKTAPRMFHEISDGSSVNMARTPRPNSSESCSLYFSCVTERNASVAFRSEREM